MSNTAPAATAASEPVNTTSQVTGAPAVTQAPPSGPAPSASVEQTPPGAAAESPPPVEVPAWKAKAEAQGFVDVNSPEEFAERSIAALELERQRAAELERQYRDAEIQAAVARMQLFPNGQVPGQQPPPATQAQDASWWNPPAVNTDLVRKFRTKDVATGAETWKPGTPPEVVAQYEAYEAYHEQWVEKLARNPVEAFKPVEERILERAKREALAEFEAKYGKVQQEQQTTQFVEQIRKENESWLYQKDPITNRPRTNPDGSYLMTPEGIEAQQLLSRYVERGFTAQEAWSEVQMHREYKQLKAGQSALTGQQAAQQKKDEFLLNAARATPGAGGTLTAASHPGAGSQNPNLSLREKLKQQMLHDGTLPVQS